MRLQDDAPGPWTGRTFPAMPRTRRLLSLVLLTCSAVCGTAFGEEPAIEGGLQLRQDAAVVPAAAVAVLAVTFGTFLAPDT